MTEETQPDFTEDEQALFKELMTEDPKDLSAFGA